jgi:hypothetical protein
VLGLRLTGDRQGKLACALECDPGVRKNRRVRELSFAAVGSLDVTERGSG